MSQIPQDVEAMFNGIADDLIQQGWKKFSARTILHKIRWHYRVDRGFRKFKVNNNWSSVLSRRFTKKNPSYANFFNQRRGSSVGE